MNSFAFLFLTRYLSKKIQKLCTFFFKNILVMQTLAAHYNLARNKCEEFVINHSAIQINYYSGRIKNTISKTKC